jgi:hypothetical protein
MTELSTPVRKRVILMRHGEVCYFNVIKLRRIQAYIEYPGQP